MALAPVVVGVADHNGWAALVCVSVKDGSPEVIDRRRVELIEPGLPICTSAASLGIDVDTFARGEERPRAAEATGTTAERLDRFLSGLRTTRLPRPGPSRRWGDTPHSSLTSPDTL